MIAIVYQNLCLGCMEASGTAATCPHCGFPAGGRPESALHLPPGKVLQDKYVIGRALGQGGFGITYLAWDSRLKLKLAIKEYLPQQLAYRTDADTAVNVYKTSLAAEFSYGREKFLEEAQTLARFIEHPNIVSVRDYFEANGTAYLVMNYHEGVTLHAYLQSRGGRIEAAQAVKIFMPVLDALKEVHGAGILHRDISPDNLLIDKNGRVILIDFGAARQAMGEKSLSLSVIMKAGYSPAEQYQSRGKQGPWTDIYAVAATIYRAVTGQTPLEAIDRMANDDLAPPSQLGVDIATKVEEALLKALAVKAEDRYQRVEEFQAELLVPRGRLKEVYAGVGARKPAQRLDVRVEEEEQLPAALEAQKRKVKKDDAQAVSETAPEAVRPRAEPEAGFAARPAPDGTAFSVSRQALKYAAAIVLGALLLIVGVSLFGGDSGTVNDAVDELPVVPANLAGLDVDYYIDYTGGTIPIGDLPIGARVVDPSWEWEYRLGFNYSDEDWEGEPTPPGEVKPVTWIVVAKDHYEGLEPHVTLLSEVLIGLFTFDDSTDRSNPYYGNEYWESSGTTDATRGLRPWLNSTGIHAEEGFYRAFSREFAQVTLLTVLPNLGPEGFYTSEDYVFIPSAIELGAEEREASYLAGARYDYFTSSYDQLRAGQVKAITANYWTRSPVIIYTTGGQLSNTGIVQLATPCGSFSSDIAATGGYGVRPAINLKADTPVTEIRKPEQEEQDNNLPEEKEQAIEADETERLEIEVQPVGYRSEQVIDFVERATSYGLLDFVLPEFDHPNDLDYETLIEAVTLNIIALSCINFSNSGRISGTDVQRIAAEIFGPDIKKIEHQHTTAFEWRSDKQTYVHAARGYGSYSRARVLKLKETATEFSVDVVHLIYDYCPYDYDGERPTYVTGELSLPSTFASYEEFTNQAIPLYGEQVKDDTIDQYLDQFPIRRYILSKEGNGAVYIRQSFLLKE